MHTFMTSYNHKNQRSQKAVHDKKIDLYLMTPVVSQFFFSWKENDSCQL